MNLSEQPIKAPSPADASSGAAGASASGQVYLTFRLGAEEYAIDIRKVRQIRGYENPTRIANTPAFIKGVIDLRGAIVPIVDMRMKFALATCKYYAFAVVIVLNVADQVLGMVVDSVSGVLKLSDNQIKAVPKFNDRAPSSAIRGLRGVKLRQPGRGLILMDIEELMAASGVALADLLRH
jgi:purine-binding chemotaxis protein CheW